MAAMTLSFVWALLFLLESFIGWHNWSPPAMLLRLVVCSWLFVMRCHLCLFARSNIVCHCVAFVHSYCVVFNKVLHWSRKLSSILFTKLNEMRQLTYLVLDSFQRILHGSYISIIAAPVMYVFALTCLLWHSLLYGHMATPHALECSHPT